MDTLAMWDVVSFLEMEIFLQQLVWILPLRSVMHVCDYNTVVFWTSAHSQESTQAKSLQPYVVTSQATSNLICMPKSACTEGHLGSHPIGSSGLRKQTLIPHKFTSINNVMVTCLFNKLLPLLFSTNTSVGLHSLFSLYTIANSFKFVLTCCTYM